MKGQGSTAPEFPDTHPNPGHRMKKTTEMACKGNKTYRAEYQRIRKLPD